MFIRLQPMPRYLAWYRKQSSIFKPFVQYILAWLLLEPLNSISCSSASCIQVWCKRTQWGVLYDWRWHPDWARKGSWLIWKLRSEITELSATTIATTWKTSVSLCCVMGLVQVLHTIVLANWISSSNLKTHTSFFGPSTFVRLLCREVARPRKELKQSDYTTGP